MSNRAWMPLHLDAYLADTGHLTTLEHGAYLLLIMHYWRNGCLPEDERMIARVARMSKDDWAESRDVLASLFRDGWRHKRIDEELAKADEIIAKRKAAAGARHGKPKGDAHAVHVDSKSTYAGASPSTDNLSDVGADAPTSPEPEKSAPVASSPTVIELPCVSGPPCPVTEDDVREWSRAFPAVDVRQQLGAMRAWLNANENRRKTRKGMRRFVVSWLDRKQNEGPRHGASGAGPPVGRRANAVEANLAIRAEHEPTSERRGSGDVELLPPDEPRLRRLFENAGQSLQWGDGSGRH